LYQTNYNKKVLIFYGN